MKKLFMVTAVSLALAACSDSQGATRALDNLGMKDIQIQGWAPFAGCSDKDTFVTRFTATNQNGKRVSGVVCSGWFKGSTVRFD